MYSHAAKMRSCDRSLKMSSSEKITNINYEADVKHMLRYTRGFLGLLGLWSMASEKSSKMEKNISKLLIPVCLIALAFIVIPNAHYVIKREKNMVARILLLNVLTFFFTNFVKYVFIIFRCRMIKLCIEHMRTDWMMIESEKERATMKRNVKLGHDITIICSVLWYGCGFIYNAIMPLWSGKTINEFNETVRPLAYPGYDTFFDLQSSPIYGIMYFTTCMSAFVGLTVSAVTCNCVAVLGTYACGQVEILILRMESLVEEIGISDNNESASQRISIVIRSHVRVLRLASKIQVILSEICFIEVLASVFIICFFEYSLIVEWNNNGFVGIIAYLMAFMSQSCNIYVFCHIGDNLNEQYHKIGVAAYMLQWYRLPGKVGINLVMIIMMANCPRNIKAGNIIELTINSFSNIMKMSLTYLNLLRKLSD